MKNIAEQITEGLDRFYKAFQKKRVLKSLEEISASTNEADIAAATAVAELSNKLDEQPEWITDPATGKITSYKTPGGADTVFPFTDVEWPDELTLFDSAVYVQDFNNFNSRITIPFLGDMYKYVTITLNANTLPYVAINGIAYNQGRHKISNLTKGVNSLYLQNAYPTGGMFLKIVLSKG